MKYISKDSREWIKKPGYRKKVFITPEEIQKDGILVQKLQILPGETAKSHFHKKQTEIFYFINTAGEFFVNEKKVKLQDGDVLVVEPGDIHKVSNKSNAVFEYIAYKFDWEEGDSYE